MVFQTNFKAFQGIWQNFLVLASVGDDVNKAQVLYFPGGRIVTSHQWNAKSKFSSETKKKICRHEKVLTYWPNSTPSKKDCTLISSISYSHFICLPLWGQCDDQKSKSHVNSFKYLLRQRSRGCQEERIFVGGLCSHKKLRSHQSKEKSVFLITTGNNCLQNTGDTYITQSLYFKTPSISLERYSLDQVHVADVSVFCVCEVWLGRCKKGVPLHNTSWCAQDYLHRDSAKYHHVNVSIYTKCTYVWVALHRCKKHFFCLQEHIRMWFGTQVLFT